MPTIKNIAGPYRLFFYSFDGNEPQHVQRDNRLCKFWLEPLVVAVNDGFSERDLNQIRNLIQENLIRIIEAWHEHCD
jgi:uncharacterized protein DUF4160